TRETGFSLCSGGRPRPSLLWQASQLRALNSGPRPSRASAVAGATIQGLLKKAFPIENAARRSTSRFGAGREKACRSLERTVIAPPEFNASSASCGADAFERHPQIAIVSAQASASGNARPVFTLRAWIASIAETL